MAKVTAAPKGSLDHVACEAIHFLVATKELEGGYKHGIHWIMTYLVDAGMDSVKIGKMIEKHLAYPPPYPQIIIEHCKNILLLMARDEESEAPLINRGEEDIPSLESLILQALVWRRPDEEKAVLGALPRTSPYKSWKGSGGGGAWLLRLNLLFRSEVK